MICSINCQSCISPHAALPNMNNPLHKMACLRNFISADCWENILMFLTQDQAVKEEFLKCLTLKKKALHCLELLWSTHPTTWHHTIETLHPQQYCCKNLKYHTKFVHFRKESLGKCKFLSYIGALQSKSIYFPIMSQSSCHTVGKIKLVTLPWYEWNLYRQMLSHSAQNQCFIMVQLLGCKDNDNLKRTY